MKPNNSIHWTDELLSLIYIYKSERADKILTKILKNLANQNLLATKKKLTRQNLQNPS